MWRGLTCHRVSGRSPCISRGAHWSRDWGGPDTWAASVSASSSSGGAGPSCWSACRWSAPPWQRRSTSATCPTSHSLLTLSSQLGGHCTPVHSSGTGPTLTSYLSTLSSHKLSADGWHSWHSPGKCSCFHKHCTDNERYQTQQLKTWSDDIKRVSTCSHSWRIFDCGSGLQLSIMMTMLWCQSSVQSRYSWITVQTRTLTLFTLPINWSDAISQQMSLVLPNWYKL